MVRAIDHGRWRVRNHEAFDGQASDSFASTSLHLSFTDYYFPLFNRDSTGQKDVQVSLLESIISIHEAGRWVADIDVLGYLEDNAIENAPETSCIHSPQALLNHTVPAVTCWDDVLDHPTGVAVVKASGNWTARLALAALLPQITRKSHRKITLCGKDVCWVCSLRWGTDNLIIS